MFGDVQVETVATPIFGHILLLYLGTESRSTFLGCTTHSHWYGGQLDNAKQVLQYFPESEALEVLTERFIGRKSSANSLLTIAQDLQLGRV